MLAGQFQTASLAVPFAIPIISPDVTRVPTWVPRNSRPFMKSLQKRRTLYQRWEMAPPSEATDAHQLGANPVPARFFGHQVFHLQPKKRSGVPKPWSAHPALQRSVALLLSRCSPRLQEDHSKIWIAPPQHLITLSQRRSEGLLPHRKIRCRSCTEYAVTMTGCGACGTRTNPQPFAGLTHTSPFRPCPSDSTRSARGA